MLNYFENKGTNTIEYLSEELYIKLINPNNIDGIIQGESYKVYKKSNKDTITLNVKNITNIFINYKSVTECMGVQYMLPMTIEFEYESKKYRMECDYISIGFLVELDKIGVIHDGMAEIPNSDKIIVVKNKKLSIGSKKMETIKTLLEMKKVSDYNYDTMYYINEKMYLYVGRGYKPVVGAATKQKKNMDDDKNEIKQIVYKNRKTEGNVFLEYDSKMKDVRINNETIRKQIYNRSLFGLSTNIKEGILFIEDGKQIFTNKTPKTKDMPDFDESKIDEIEKLISAYYRFNLCNLIKDILNVTEYHSEKFIKKGEIICENTSKYKKSEFNQLLEKLKSIITMKNTDINSFLDVLRIVHIDISKFDEIPQSGNGYAIFSKNDDIYMSMFKSPIIGCYLDNAYTLDVKQEQYESYKKQLKVLPTPKEAYCFYMSPENDDELMLLSSQGLEGKDVVINTELRRFKTKFLYDNESSYFYNITEFYQDDFVKNNLKYIDIIKDSLYNAGIKIVQDIDSRLYSDSHYENDAMVLNTGKYSAKYKKSLKQILEWFFSFELEDFDKIAPKMKNFKLFLKEIEKKSTGK